MEILIYSDNYYPEPGGTPTLITQLGEGLTARGHRVRAITARLNDPEHGIRAEAGGRLYVAENRNGVTMQRCVPTLPRLRLGRRLRLESSLIALSLGPALQGWRPDIMLNSSPFLPTRLTVALLKTLFHCPSWVNLQDILPEATMQTGQLSPPETLRLADILEQLAGRNATRTQVTAQGWRKRVPTANRVNVNFIAPRPQTSSKFRHRHHLHDKFVVLYSDPLAAAQVTTALQAAQHLSAYPAIQLVIVGDGKQLKALNQLRQELGLTNISLLPLVPRSELPDLLAAADVGLILQQHNEIVGNLPSKTEALLASGRPILALVPAHDPTAQTVTASGGGMVIAPGDPVALAQGILDLYHHPAKAKSLARRGRQYALGHFPAKGASDRNVALFYALATR